MMFRVNASILIGGTLFSQLMSFVAIPIIASIYSPNEFAVLGIITAFIGWLSPIMSLRLDMAIPIASRDKERKLLAQLSVLIALFFSFLVLIVSMIFCIFDVNKYGEYSFFVGVGCFVYSLFNVFQAYNLSSGKIKVIAVGKVGQTIVSLMIQIVLGSIFNSYYPLLIGQIVLGGGAGIFLLYQISIGLSKGKFLQYRLLIKKYAQYPKVSTLESILSSSSSQLPFVMLSKLVDYNSLGIIAMTMKLLGAPSILIGRPFSQLYISDAKVRFKQGELLGFTSMVALYALIFGGGAIFSLLALSNVFIPSLFDSEWNGLFGVMLLMFPYYLSQIIVSPIMYSFHVLGKLMCLSLIQVLLLVIKLTSLGLVYLFSMNCYLLVYSLVGTLSYVFLAFVAIFFIRKHEG